jgi:hypothetical protein
MDQFQASILSKISLEISAKDAKISISNETLIIEQSENAYLTVYDIKLKLLGVDVIQIDRQNIIKVQDQFSFKLDFENPSRAITFKFQDGIANELTLPILFKGKDKASWDKKIEFEKLSGFIKIADINSSTGLNLVNIYFRPCSDDYEKTIVDLYTALGSTWANRPSVMGRGDAYIPTLLIEKPDAKPDKFIGKFTVESDMFFKSITGLAFGAYAFRISQYSKSGSLLFTSEYQYFAIQKH